MNITLYGLDKTRSVRVQWLLAELELDYKYVEVNIFKGEGMRKQYRKIHPYGQVPAVKVDDKLIFESGAICHWLSDQYLQQGLAPALDSPLRCEYEQWMFYVPATLEPPAWQYMLHQRILPADKRIQAVAEWHKQQYINTLKVLNRLLRHKDYLLGEQFSTADIMLGYLLFWFPDILQQFPVLKNYSQRLRQRKAYQDLGLRT